MTSTAQAYWELPFEITWSDLALGKLRNPRSCPVAKSLGRALREIGYNDAHVSVSPISGVKIRTSAMNDDALYGELHPAVNDLITNFDCIGWRHWAAPCVRPMKSSMKIFSRNDWVAMGRKAF